MDHTVKIWQMPSVRSDGSDKSLMIKREDKPLFSSTRVHMAQVLSIAWYVTCNVFVLAVPSRFYIKDEQRNLIIAQRSCCHEEENGRKAGR